MQNLMLHQKRIQTTNNVISDLEEKAKEKRRIMQKDIMPYAKASIGCRPGFRPAANHSILIQENYLEADELDMEIMRGLLKGVTVYRNPNRRNRLM